VTAMLPMQISSQKYKVTLILVVANVAMYIYTSVVGGNFLNTNSDIFPTNILVQYNNAILNYGAYHQLFTSMFIHASIVHLAGNMLFLVIFGLRGEEMFSLPEFFAVYLLGGIAGNVLSLIMGPDLVSVGASGAIFSLFGACAIYARRSIGQSVIGAVIFGFFLLIISTGENVNILAHVGGLLAGLSMGYVLARIRRRPTSYHASYSNMSPF
jgi:rhomboid protease GluP